MIVAALVAGLGGCQARDSESKPAGGESPAAEPAGSATKPTPPPVDQQVKKVNEALRETGLVAVPSPVTGKDAWWIPADQACPDGATLHGEPPPGGTEIWCALPDGKKHGRATRWGKVGNKLADGEYQNGVKNGRFTAYHKNGQKKMTVTYVDGKEEGPVTTWYPNGQKALEGTYRDGKGYGAWTKWDPDGNKTAEGSY